MRTATNDSVLSAWLWGITHHKPTQPGGFLRDLAIVAFKADRENYEILRPALIAIMEKYPEYHWIPGEGWVAEG